MIDIAMTTALRPGVMAQTLESIQRNLHCSEEFRLILNVDPVGEEKICQSYVVETAGTYFSSIIARTPDKASHPDAVIWTWDKSSSEFVLQWEDDYRLEKAVNLDQLLELMRLNCTVGSLGFDRCNKSVLDYPGYKGRFIPLVDKVLWQRQIGKSIAGPPAILRQTYIRDMLPLITGELDLLAARPDVQKALDKWKIWIYAGLDGNLVLDIGTPWLIKNGIKKSKRYYGITWKKTG